MTCMYSDDDTASRVIRALRSYMADPRTETLRELAPLMVDLRARHHLSDGRTDWQGRSAAYRDAIADIYTAAGVSREERDGLQSALRYHIGHVLRERLSREELEDSGLSPSTPRETRRARREALQSLRDLAAGVAGASGSVLSSAAMAQNILESVSDDAASGLSDDERRAALRALAAVAARVEDLRQRVNEGGKPRNGLKLTR